MNEYAIGVFDSGIGGVSVLKELIKKMPNENYIYLSDSLNNPYGDKSHNDLLDICKKNVESLLNKNCKTIVIACNTATVRIADELRNIYKDITIFGIEPAYKMIYDYDYDKNTLIMATKGTVESNHFKELFDKYNNNKTYILSCPGLADLIEEGNTEKIKEYLLEKLSMYKGLIESVVIGCTHYFFIEDEIKEVLGDVKFYYGAESVAKNVYSFLQKEKKLSNNSNKGTIEFIDTSNLVEKVNRFWKFINEE